MSYELTILEGSTFCICDEIGDLDGMTSGFFADDTRFLSRLELRINGERPLLLSSGKVEYFSAAFFLRNPLARGLDQDVLSISRERFVGEGMQDQLLRPQRGLRPPPRRRSSSRSAPTSPTSSPSRSTTSRSATRDKARPLPAPAAVRSTADGNQLVLDGERRRQRPDAGDLLPAGRAGRRHDAVPDRARAARALGAPDRRRRRRSSGEESPPMAVEQRFGDEREHVRDSLAAWQLSVPSSARAGDYL